MTANHAPFFTHTLCYSITVEHRAPVINAKMRIGIESLSLWQNKRLPDASPKHTFVPPLLFFTAGVFL